jgi:Putative Ig domain
MGADQVAGEQREDEVDDQAGQCGEPADVVGDGAAGGLSINSSTGLISGTPTTAGSPSVTVKATDTTGASGSATFTWTVTNTVTATTALSYTGPDQVATGSRFTATATLTSPAASCESSQSVSFSLSANPLNGTSSTYSLGSATSTSSGAISLPVSTTNWQIGVYMLTVSYIGASSRLPSTTTASVAVTSPGQAAFGGGWYNVPGVGQTGFAFVVARVPHSSGTYKGVLEVVTPGRWWFQANVTHYAKSSTTRGCCPGRATCTGGTGPSTEAAEAGSSPSRTSAIRQPPTPPPGLEPPRSASTSAIHQLYTDAATTKAAAQLRANHLDPWRNHPHLIRSNSPRATCIGRSHQAVNSQ